MTELAENKVAVNIPHDLYEKIKRKVEPSQGEFRSVDAYVEFVLREVVKEEWAKQVCSPEEEERVKQRLRSLGYL